ncbi:MAG: tetraacyldisaccharide 4'-kinase [Vicinamibacterales bacterium]
MPGLGALGSLYGWAAARRRARYRAQPARARRLARPVVSVGNLTVGGSGKTPLVIALAAALQQAGERPAILSRGYARRAATGGVTVVSDREGVRAAVEASGDEPQVMARRLPGVPVLVAASRYLAGRAAERDHGCTVHLLDDGFQHLPLARDADLLVLSAADIRERVLPAGRLREPAAAAWAADAWLVGEGAPEEVAAALGPAPQGPTPAVFTFTTRVGAPRRVVPFGEAAAVVPGNAVAVSGIARPERFFAAARAAGWSIAREWRFRDHHWFTERDWRAIADAARAAGATVLTTEKDAVRLEPLLRSGNAGVDVVYLPIDVDLPAALVRWLTGRLAERRA